LREALAARPDDDFVLSAPVRRKSAVKPKPRKIGPAERAMAFVLRHPRRIVAAVFLSGCGGVIAWNALVHQTSSHPAPLFTQRAAAPEPAPATTRRLPPVRPAPAFEEVPAAALQEAPPAHAPAASPQAAAPSVSTPKSPSRSPITDLIRNGGEAGPAAANPKPAPPAPQAAAAPPAPAKAAPAARDPIAEIIRMGGPVPTPPANVGKADAGEVVLAGQRALAKLGYGVKADGIMGAGTRQAIERFEQDRRLPVTGEFGARTARELSAASGITVQ
jgi:hypothetical protein